VYGPLWRALPGRWPLKLAQALVLLALVVVVCFQWLFPVVAEHLPFNDNTVTAGTPAGHAATTRP
jgi:hypothetical protein